MLEKLKLLAHRTKSLLTYYFTSEVKYDDDCELWSESEIAKLERFVNDAVQPNIEYFIKNRHEMNREQQERFLWRMVENTMSCTLLAIEEGL